MMAIDERELFTTVELEMSATFRQRLEQDLRAAVSARIQAESRTLSPQALVGPEPTTRRRRWLTLSAAALILAVIAGVAMIQLGDVGKPDRAPSAPSVVTATETSPVPSTSSSTTSPPDGTSGVRTTAALAAGAINWTTVDLGTDSPVNAAFNQVTGDGPLFAWTSDNTASPVIASQLFRSDDGLSWTEVPIAAGFSIVAATATSARVALLGFSIPTDPLAAAEMVAMLSDDAGSTWRTVAFDVTLPRRTAAGATLVRPADALIAEHDDTVVASFSTVDRWSDSIAPTTDASGRSIPDERPLYVSIADQPFVPVSSNDPSASPEPTVALSYSNGEFLALATPPSSADPAVLWRSDDGRTWTPLGPVPDTVPGATVGKLGDRYIVVPLCCHVPWISDNGSDWSAATIGGDLNATASSTLFDAHAAMSPDGISVAATYLGPAPDIDYSKDGVTQRLVGGTLSDVIFLDEATGAELGHITATPFDNGIVRALGDGKVDILDTEGNIRTTFTPADLPKAFNSAPAAPYVGVVLHSDDGSDWTSTSLETFLGGNPTGLSWLRPIGEVTTLGAFVNTRDAAGAHLVVLVGRRQT